MVGQQKNVEREKKLFFVFDFLQCVYARRACACGGGGSAV
jgi:hypothetical protein